jgi:hypothetical protein
MRHVARLVPPADHEIAGPEHLAQLVADQIDDSLEVQRRGHSLLDAVDDRELMGALLELRGALRDFLLEAFRKAHIVERDRCLRREEAEQVAVGIAKAPEHAVDVGVQVAD